MPIGNDRKVLSRVFFVSSLALISLLAAASQAATNVGGVSGRPEDPAKWSCFRTFGGANVTNTCQDSVAKFFEIPLPSTSSATSNTYSAILLDESASGFRLGCRVTWTTSSGGFGSGSWGWATSASWQPVSLGTVSVPANSTRQIECTMTSITGKSTAINYVSY